MSKDKYNISDKEDYLESASCNDCTGLIPTAIKTEDELESYKSIYNFSPAQIEEIVKKNKPSS